MRQIAIWLGVSVAPAGAEVDEVVSTTASGTTTSRAGAQPVLNPFDDGSAIQVVAGTRSGEADFGLPLLLQLEDACVAAREALPLEDRARADRLIGIRARSQATAGGTSLVGEFARFVHGAAADGRSRTTASRDRYARARITKAYLWPDLPGSSLTSDVIQSDFTNLFQIVLSASWAPSAKGDGMPRSTPQLLDWQRCAFLPERAVRGCTLRCLSLSRRQVVLDAVGE